VKVLITQESKTNMKKITYLLGAGASAGPNELTQALPLVNSITKNGVIIKEGMPAAFRRVGRLLAEEADANNVAYARQLKERFETLAKKSEDFDTVDTLAKYSYLKDRAYFDEIKRLLSIYFTVDQGINKKLDKRYLVFLTTILEEQKRFPDHVKLITWNYDAQWQMANSLQKFC
jgi:hypothetical protein